MLSTLLASLVISLTALSGALAEAETLEATLPPPPVTVPQSAPKLDCEAFRPLFEKYDWPVETALEVCHFESHGRVQAYNPEWHNGCQGSHSLMQVACIHFKAGEDRYDPALNVAKAFNIWKQSGGFEKPWKTTCTKKMEC